jgi:hypothetical protein
VEVFSREDLPYSICQQCSEPNSPEASSVGCHVVPAPGGLGVVDLLPPSPLLPSQERVCIGYEPILGEGRGRELAQWARGYVHTHTCSSDSRGRVNTSILISSKTAWRASWWGRRHRLTVHCCAPLSRLHSMASPLQGSPQVHYRAPLQGSLQVHYRAPLQGSPQVHYRVALHWGILDTTEWQRCGLGSVKFQTLRRHLTQQLMYQLLLSICNYL